MSSEISDVKKYFSGSCSAVAHFNQRGLQIPSYIVPLSCLPWMMFKRRKYKTLFCS